MIELWYYVKSDFFKLRNSSFFWAHILFPISGAALVLLYAVFAAVSDINKIAVFFQLFAIAYPFCYQYCLRDCRRAGNPGWALSKYFSAAFQNQGHFIQIPLAYFRWLVRNIVQYIPVNYGTSRDRNQTDFASIFPYVASSDFVEQ